MVDYPVTARIMHFGPTKQNKTFLTAEDAFLTRLASLDIRVRLMTAQHGPHSGLYLESVD